MTVRARRSQKLLSLDPHLRLKPPPQAFSAVTSYNFTELSQQSSSQLKRNPSTTALLTKRHLASAGSSTWLSQAHRGWCSREHHHHSCKQTFIWADSLSRLVHVQPSRHGRDAHFTITGGPTFSQPQRTEHRALFPGNRSRS